MWPISEKSYRKSRNFSQIVSKKNHAGFIIAKFKSHKFVDFIAESL